MWNSRLELIWDRFGGVQKLLDWPHWPPKTRLKHDMPIWNHIGILLDYGPSRPHQLECQTNLGGFDDS